MSSKKKKKYCSFQLTFEKELFQQKKENIPKSNCIQLTFKKQLFPYILPDDIYKRMDRSIREAVIRMHYKNINTNSSEGGGGKRHGASDFAYIEAKLTKKNMDICKKLNILLNKIYSSQSPDDLLFNGSGIDYGKKTGFYIIGFVRKELTDRKVRNKFIELISMLTEQY